MHLVFGLSADGRVYPEATEAVGAIDAAVVGPAGLVGVLEVQLGLLGPSASRAVRIASYLAKLRAAGDGRFWGASFEKDPWSTAATLLQWRDDLIAAGWQGNPIGARRIDDLAAAEIVGTMLPPGLADRAVQLLDALPSRPGLRLKRLTLAEPRALLPPLWRRMLEALAAVGVTVDQHDGCVAAAEGSDLRQVQRALAGEGREQLTGDGTFVVVEADTELMAAEVIADWLAVSPAEERAGTVVLAPDGDTALLDHALRARGLPALGLSVASPWRGALQVLPLAFAAAWQPFDPRVLLNLLMLPRPPISRWAARRLARALSKEPGIGGAAWLDAWAGIEVRLVETHAELEPKDARKEVDAVLAEWRTWTDVGRFDRSLGIPTVEAQAIAGRVAAWAMRADAGRNDRLLLAVAAAAGAVVDALNRLEQEVVPALLLERIVSQVLSEGVVNPDHVPEAGSVRAVRSPGALWSAAPRVIWWGFVGPGERVSRDPWDRAEVEALEAGGVTLETSADAARRIGAGYTRVLQRSAERLIFVRPALSGDEQTTVHPLAHQLRPIVGGAGEGVVFKAERVLREPDAALAGRLLTRHPVESKGPPVGAAKWTLPAGAAGLMEGRRESATSLRRLFNCHFGWFAQDVLGLRPGRFAEIPGPDQLFGNLAHEIARRLLPPGPPPPTDGVRAAATVLFEMLLPQIAAPLLQPEYAGELSAARELVPAALESLVGLLHKRDLEVVGSELEREGSHRDLALEGRLDLLVRRGPQVAVLDLKWTRSERRYREEIAKGQAVQLAVYRAISAHAGVKGTGGYFLLRQRRILAGDGSILTDHPIESERADTETLDMVAGDWKRWRDLASSGVLVAAGFDDAADHRPEGLEFQAPKEPCRFCDLTSLCRVQVETI
ncbi:PD-(D/E)XK nuclease family protein [Sinorhizobium meliloti]|uniref:PD-(D/E)XK nuclease family protein n=1 Tax=Rhizobium meliloti TaxID=382 RepID=UPI000FD6BA0C|nr:PD-(D/E)XK nuclease family protein [Sinorhizobium meliloti]RVE87058.1 PD-(D/E)XK nuclease family protein [Sinorhizobium meliloti]